MECLSRAVASGFLLLACPNCKTVGGFQESGLGCGLLHCERCFAHTSPVEWVQRIISQGDDDPFIYLMLMRTPNGFSIQVNTDERGSSNAEYIRFCSLASCRSPRVREALRHVMADNGEVKHKEICFPGEGGQLKVAVKHGFPDLWLKTENQTVRDHGALVGFRSEDQTTPILEKLLAAMLLDLQERPAFQD